jgi:hypothetical protein
MTRVRHWTIPFTSVLCGLCATSFRSTPFLRCELRYLHAAPPGNPYSTLDSCLISLLYPGDVGAT